MPVRSGPDGVFCSSGLNESAGGQPDHSNSVTRMRTDLPSFSFLTISRWLRRAAGFHPSELVRCGFRTVTLTRAMRSALGGSAVPAADKMAQSRKTMPHQWQGEASARLHLGSLWRNRPPV